MAKIDLNLQFLLNEYEILDRYKKSHELGFKFVELQHPYSLDLNLLSSLISDLDMAQVLINIDLNNDETGKMNLAIDPKGIDKFKSSVDNSLRYCTELSVKVINCTPGPAIDDLERSVQYQTLTENLSYAAPLFEECGTRLLIEPINTFDQPGFFISNSKDGAKVVADVSHRNFGLQYDVYHMQLMEGNIMNNIKKYIDIIGHFQIADVPGRLEPGKGEIGYSNIFKFIDDLGYEGFIGAEYKPENTTEEGLEWIKKYDGLEIA